ncbi:hypothetical protein DdX_00942 [Ditylenchus destructor]|uniref:Uncharacterized protein n=1 Tax=Ditylenchus destructor TaxID=166010 RepID=A0AAD4NFX8_9BILA|nr:hypothetical protein DdX_00942 [Ditylenchus destructor]
MVPYSNIPLKPLICACREPTDWRRLPLLGRFGPNDTPPLPGGLGRRKMDDVRRLSRSDPRALGSSKVVPGA